MIIAVFREQLLSSGAYLEIFQSIFWAFLPGAAGVPPFPSRTNVVTSWSRRRAAVRALSAGATFTEASQPELEPLFVYAMPCLVSDYTCPRAAFHRRFSVLCRVSFVWAFGGVYQQQICYDGTLSPCYGSTLTLDGRPSMNSPRKR